MCATYRIVVGVVTIGPRSVAGEPSKVALEPLAFPLLQQPGAVGSTGSQWTWIWLTPPLRVQETSNCWPLLTTGGGCVAHVMVGPGGGVTTTGTTVVNASRPFVACRTWAAYRIVVVVATLGAVSVAGEPISVPVEPLGLVGPPVQQPAPVGLTGSQCTWTWSTLVLRVQETENVCPLVAASGGAVAHAMLGGPIRSSAAAIRILGFVTPRPETSPPVACKAFRTSATLAVGTACLRMPQAPVTCGAAMEVPLK
jgi:hypothetical protein